MRMRRNARSILSTRQSSSLALTDEFQSKPSTSNGIRNSSSGSLQKTYRKYKKELRATGAGLTEEEQNSEGYRNKIGMHQYFSSTVKVQGLIMSIDAIVAEFRWWHDLNSMWSESPKLNAPFNTNSATRTEDLEAQLAGALASIEPGNSSAVGGTSGTGAVLVEYIDSESDDDVAVPADLLKQPRPVKAENSDDFEVSNPNLNRINDT